MGEPGSPRAWSAGWQAQGKKVSPPPLRPGDRGAAVLRPDQAIREATWFARRTASREKTWRTSSGPHKRPGSSSEEKETLAYRKAVTPVPDQGRYSRRRHRSVGQNHRRPEIEALRGRLPHGRNLRSGARRIPNRIYDEPGPQPSLAADARENGDSSHVVSPASLASTVGFGGIPRCGRHRPARCGAELRAPRVPRWCRLPSCFVCRPLVSVEFLFRGRRNRRLLDFWLERK